MNKIKSIQFNLFTNLYNFLLIGLLFFIIKFIYKNSLNRNKEIKKIKKYVRNGTPFVIKNGAKLMNAYNRWDDKYLKKNIGKDKFDVEKSYSNIFSPSDPFSKAGYEKMTFNDFSVKYLKNNMNETNKKHLNYYLAEIEVPDKLSKDVKNPFFEVFKRNPLEKHLFLGIGGNITRTHYDSYDNFYFLLDGTKEITLISPKYDNNLYIPKNKKGKEENYIKVDIENIDYNKYPLMKNVQLKKIKLQKGDMLFIPDGWWHHVKSGVSRNLAVSLWY
tara:strand:+ start:2694 stop:3515 length:822 start_codon:yes stop_codon:yes gene_type:complete